MRGRYRHAQRVAVEALAVTARRGDLVVELRAWKMFGLLPILLLHKPASTGTVGKAELENRCSLFARGEWRTLLRAAAISEQPVVTQSVQRRATDVGGKNSRAPAYVWRSALKPGKL